MIVGSRHPASSESLCSGLQDQPEDLYALAPNEDVSFTCGPNDLPFWQLDP